jgi:ABC-type lipoprotein release transport system permease subunit
MVAARRQRRDALRRGSRHEPLQIRHLNILAGLLFGVTPTDPVTFLAIALLFSAVALTASAAPARRAMRVEPLVALRHD